MCVYIYIENRVTDAFYNHTHKLMPAHMHTHTHTHAQITHTRQNTLSYNHLHFSREWSAMKT